MWRHSSHEIERADFRYPGASSPYNCSYGYGQPQPTGRAYVVPPETRAAANRAMARIEKPTKRIARKSMWWWVSMRIRRAFGREVNPYQEFQDRILPDIMANKQDIAIAAARGAEVILPMMGHAAGNWADRQEHRLYGRRY